MADRWKQANTVGACVVLKCSPAIAAQPGQLAPVRAGRKQPGRLLVRDLARLLEEGRDLPRLARVCALAAEHRRHVASDAPFQLVTTFDGRGGGTAVESASEWSTSSGYSAYLDELHAVGGGECAPTTCSAEGWNCGSAGDGCSGTLSAGPAARGHLRRRQHGQRVRRRAARVIIAIAGDIAGSWARTSRPPTSSNMAPPRSSRSATLHDSG
jgi:hypothetical protein